MSKIQLIWFEVQHTKFELYLWGKRLYPRTTSYRVLKTKCSMQQRIDLTQFSLPKYHKLSMNLFNDLEKFE